MDSSPHRFFRDGVFTSTDLPAVRVRVDPAFEYLGSHQFEIYEAAQVERHIFVDAQDGSIQRLLIFQFEGYLSDNDYAYQWGVTNPIDLGGQTYHHNTYCYNNNEVIQQQPGSEPDHTTRILREKGYTLEDELMMSRFARIVGDDQRHELIIFYIENVNSTGHTLQEISEEGAIVEKYGDLSEALTRRALESFEVLE